MDVLKGLGVPVRGRRPRLERAGVLAGGALIPLTRHLRRDVGDRLRVARALGGLGAADAALWAGQPASAWIDQVTDDESGRAVLASVLRTTTYAADLDLLDAGAATTQLRAAMHGVLYLHGGWSSIVDGLAAVVRRHGGEIVTGCPVSTVEHDERVRAVHLADGRTLPAVAAVIAVNEPRRAAGHAGGRRRGAAGGGRRRGRARAHGSPRRGAAAAALDALPEPPRRRRADLPHRPELGRRTAPPTAVRSSRSGATSGPAKSTSTTGRAWRRCSTCTSRTGVTTSIDARYVPRSMVSGDHARAATRGPAGRPGVDAAGVGGLTLAGDWVGPVGMIGDASILSGAAAANVVAGDMMVGVRSGSHGSVTDS